MDKSPHFSQQTQAKQCKLEVEKICIQQKTELIAEVTGKSLSENNYYRVTC